MRGTSAEAIERTESSLPEAAESFLRGNTSAGYLAVKRLADIVCALAGLILLAAPMLILSAIIVIDSPGPAIFRQERLGKNGKTFMILKFRTMRLNAEETGRSGRRNATRAAPEWVFFCAAPGWMSCRSCSTSWTGA